jgi:hypothetical protein
MKYCSSTLPVTDGHNSKNLNVVNDMCMGWLVKIWNSVTYCTVCFLSCLFCIAFAFIMHLALTVKIHYGSSMF